MADLTAYIPIGSTIADFLQDGYTYDGDPRFGFMDEMRRAGFTGLPQALVLNKLTRCDAPGDKKGQRTGWFVYHESDDTRHPGRAFGIGSYGSWRGNPEKVTWQSKSVTHMTDGERAAYNQQVENMKAARDNEQRLIHAEAAERAAAIYMDATPAVQPDGSSLHHPYLAMKGIGALGAIRLSRGDIVIPVYSEPNTIASLQFIKPDGSKKFLTGGRKKGCFFVIQSGDAQQSPQPKPSVETIYVVEGYATGASVHMATGCTVYVAFDAGNLFEVCSYVKQAHPDSHITIAADDDQFTEAGNAGQMKASQAASALSLTVASPRFNPSSLTNKPTDWNDLHKLEGIEEVKAQLVPVVGALKAYDKKKKAAVRGESGGDRLRPGGILGQIVDYYKATSGNDQPLFAIQTSIAIGSVLCARNYTTNLSNRSSIFMLNLASSGSGKEHAKKVMEMVLEACGQAGLINGDGYTAGASVISALMMRPRHITVIDEFSKYLQAAQNKFGNSHLMEANSVLMQAFGRLDGTMRPRAYATIGLTKDRQKDMANMSVSCPAITLLGMATPSDLFEKMETGSLKDGFLNRFLVCVSDAPRAIREHKEPLDVPQSIIDWAMLLEQRAGKDGPSAEKPTNLQTLYFSTEAYEAQREFQQWCIDRADEYERFDMAEMPMRCNEIAMRLSLVHALSRDPYAHVVDADDMGWAIRYVRYHHEILVDRLKMAVSGSDFEACKKACLMALREAGEKGIPYAKMQTNKPFSLYKTKDLQEVLKALEEAELIDVQPIKSGKRGRPSFNYMAIE